MMSLLTIIAGIGWEPEIRGLLFVMGIFWWIYGIGWVGSLPTWEVEDVFSDPPGIEVAGIGDAFIGNVGDLPDANCTLSNETKFPPEDVASVRLEKVSGCTPRAVDVFMAFDGPERETILQELLNPQLPESKLDAILTRGYNMDRFTDVDDWGVSTLDVNAALGALSQSQRDDVFHQLVDARAKEITDLVADNNDRSPDPLDAAGLAGFQAERLQQAQVRIDQMSLSFLKGAAPDIMDWAIDEGHVDLRGWELQTASQSGEATAAADEFLRGGLFPEGEFVVLDAYQQGGKAKRDGTGMGTRIWHKIRSTAQITHPTNYTVINVQGVIEQEPDPSKPPWVPVADETADTYSVVLIRNLGNLRVIPGLFTMGSLVLFLLTCYVLHTRDLALREKGLEV